MIASTISALKSSGRSAQAPMMKSNSAGMSSLLVCTHLAHFSRSEGFRECSEVVSKVSSGQSCAPWEAPVFVRFCRLSVLKVTFSVSILFISLFGFDSRLLHHFFRYSFSYLQIFGLRVLIPPPPHFFSVTLPYSFGDNQNTKEAKAHIASGMALWPMRVCTALRSLNQRRFSAGLEEFGVPPGVLVAEGIDYEVERERLGRVAFLALEQEGTAGRDHRSPPPVRAQE